MPAKAPAPDPDPSRADHRAAAVRLVAEAESRTAAITSGARGELNTARILGDKVRTRHDLDAAAVHALIDIGDAVRALTDALRSTP